LLNRCVDDIKRLLQPKTADFSGDRDVVTLQSDSGHQVASGVNYDGPDDYGDTLW
jgi:CRISPR-associated protein Cas1